MLNEREMALARELARGLTQVGGGNEEQVMNDAIRLISAVKNIWQGVKETLENIFQTLKEMQYNRKDQDFNWVVPLKINPPPMPDIEFPKMQLARSNL